MLTCGQFPLCVRSHAPRSLRWPESLRRTFQEKARWICTVCSCKALRRLSVQMRGHESMWPATIGTVLYPIHTQSPVKRRALAFSKESWPVFCGRCVMRTRRKPSKNPLWAGERLTVQNTSVTFPCALPCVHRFPRNLHTKHPSHQSSILCKRQFPIAKHGFLYNSPQGIVLFNHYRTRARSQDSRSAIHAAIALLRFN